MEYHPEDDPTDIEPSERQGEEHPARPVDNPDLPEEGDPDDFEEEPIFDHQFGQADEGHEEREEPNDLSGIDKEFDDDEDNH